MIIKHGRHNFCVIHEVHVQGFDCADADWLDRKTPITWCVAKSGLSFLLMDVLSIKVSVIRITK